MLVRYIKSTTGHSLCVCPLFKEHRITEHGSAGDVVWTACTGWHGLCNISPKELDLGSTLHDSAGKTLCLDTGLAYRPLLQRKFILFKLINMYRSIILPVILCGSSIDSYRKFWGDNLLRMDGLRISKIAYEYNSKGRRNVGHPRKRWEK